MALFSNTKMTDGSGTKKKPVNTQPSKAVVEQTEEEEEKKKKSAKGVSIGESLAAGKTPPELLPDYTKPAETVTPVNTTVTVTPTASTITTPTIMPPTINSSDYMKSYSDQSNYANSLNSDLYGRINTDVEGYNTRWADYYDFLQSDPSKNEGYQSIRNSYTEKGKSAAGAAVADSASTNSGNIDSFAAANANRQQIAYENAGADKALDFWNSLASQYGAGLSSQAAATNQARSTQSGLVGNAYGAASDMGAYDYNSRYATADTETSTANTAEDSIAAVVDKINKFDPDKSLTTQMVSAITALKKADPANAYTYDDVKSKFEEWYNTLIQDPNSTIDIGDFVKTLTSILGWNFQ